MRRVFAAVLCAATALAVLPSVAEAQSRPQGGRERDRDRPGQGQDSDEDRGPERPRFAPLRRPTAAGPCPYVKVLYDAARYVELADNRPAASNVVYSGEIEGVNSGCMYQNEEPIRVEMNLLFRLGKGPRAEGDQRTFRYWVAVTERNRAVLAKEYFDLPVDFKGADRLEVNEQQAIVIPRAEATTSGGAFEILVGFDVTPEQADFNRTGSRFRINAGQTAAQPQPGAGQPQ